jgi:hypothetical protein
MSASTSTDTNNNNMILVTLKWSKQTFELNLDRSQPALDFKGNVQQFTGVPIHRQKLLAKKGGWKGTLSDDFAMDSISPPKNNSLTVTLIGSAETLAGPTTQTTFVEDLTAEQVKAAERAELEAAMKTAEGMIPALQMEPHKRDDRKTELYQYNHMVKGLPQRQVEDLLKEQAKESTLLGKVAMTMGLELRRAYVNDMAVLEDGTLISAFDDGHIQMWKHGTQQNDAIHPQGGGEGGVDSVVAWNTMHRKTRLAFASAGRGSIQLWYEDGEKIIGFPAAPVPGGTSPTGLVQLPIGGGEVVALAARFQITRIPNPHQFRLPPQNEQERQRRAQAEAQEQALQGALTRVSQSVQVWYSVGGGGDGGSMALKSRVLEIGNGGAGPITWLESIPLPSTETACLLVAGDSSGGLRIWRVELDSQNNDINFQEQTYVRLTPAGDASTTGCSIICMKALHNGMVAVSTTTTTTTTSRGGMLVDYSRQLAVAESRAVHILSLGDHGGDFRVVTTVNGHQDAVQCLCELPNGDLLTGGGKMDATIKLWGQTQLYESTSGGAALLTDPTKSLPSAEIGYVFGLQVLSDTKADSKHFAVAAARYNVVKIVL